MAAGVPVIGSDVLGISEVIRHRENGLLFPSNDRKKLTECIVTLLNDDALRERISLSGRRSVERIYSFQNMIAGYEKLFSSF
jgi:glycosyltransferase involved in cell wall biosynthesis